jgi:hypothetical protein
MWQILGQIWWHILVTYFGDGFGTFGAANFEGRFGVDLGSGLWVASFGNGFGTFWG